MKYLTRREEHVLLAILQLKDNAYLVTIRKHLKNLSESDLSFGTLYVLLKRLEKINYIENYLGEATAKRGGKAIKYFKLAKEGIKALEEIEKIQKAMWADFNNSAYKV